MTDGPMVDVSKFLVAVHQMQDAQVFDQRIGAFTRNSLTADIEHLETAEQAVTRRALVRVTAAVLGRDLPELTWSHTERAEFEFPASWWQHWKRDHADSRWAGWIARRWPVRLNVEFRALTYVVDVSRAALFPEAPQFPAGAVEILGHPVLHVDQPRTRIVEEVLTDDE